MGIYLVLSGTTKNTMVLPCFMKKYGIAIQNSWDYHGTNMVKLWQPLYVQYANVFHQRHNQVMVLTVSLVSTLH